MTVSSIVPVNNYVGNNSATKFDFDFRIENKDELVVTLFDNNSNVKIELLNDVDYSISGIGSENGGYIIFPSETSSYSVLSNEQTISLALNLEIKQESEFKNSSHLNLKTLEYSLDYLTRLIQIQARVIDRAIKVEEGSQSTADELINSINNKTIESKKASDNSLNYAQQASSSARMAQNQVVIVEEVNNKINETYNKIVQGGMFKYQLFDVVPKERILTYEESQGFAPLGTYVYKEAVSGSRYGYPDFYAKCLAEYNECATDMQYYLKSNVGYVGSVDDQKGILSNFSNANYALLPKTFAPANGDTWEIVIKCKFNSFNAYNFVIACTEKYKGLQFGVSSAGKLQVSLSSTGNDYDICNNLASGSATLNIDTDYYLKLAFDGSAYECSYSTDGEVYTTDITINNVNTVVANTYRLGVSDILETFVSGSIDLNESYININGESWWNGVNYLKVKKHANGHQFYNIADKSTIDDFYKENGEAWLYGIDTENERVFLPRKASNRRLIARKTATDDDPSWFNLYSDGWCEQGGTCLNSTLLATVKLLKPYKDTNYLISAMTMDTNNTIICTVACSVKTGSRFEYINSASDTALNFWATCGYTTEIAEVASSVMYMVVGNTQTESAITNVIDVTTSANDTVPLFSGMYFDFAPNNVCWLKAGQQSNSADIYTTAYNELVNELTSPKYGLKVINEADMISGVDYSEYWKVNQDNLSFVCPVRTSERILVTKKKSTADDPTWYNLYSDGWLEQGGSSKMNGSGLCIPLLKNYKDAEYTANISANSNTTGWVSVYIKNKDVNSFWMDGTGSLNSEERAIKFSWFTCGYTEIPTENNNLYFKIANAVENLELLNAGKVFESLTEKISRDECSAYIVETSDTSLAPSWYRIWSDGMCEQGGVVDYTNVVNTAYPITFLKQYKDDNVALLMTRNTNYTGQLSNGFHGSWTSKVVSTGFTCFSDANTTPFSWHAIGYLAQGDY